MFFTVDAILLILAETHDILSSESKSGFIQSIFRKDITVTIMNRRITLLTIDSDKNYARNLSAFAQSYPNFLDAAYVDEDENIFEKTALLRPDVIITDFLVPGMDILCFLRYIKSLYTEKKPCIIIHSLVMPANMVRTASEHGADYFIAKPQPYSEICKTVSDLVNLSAAPAPEPTHQNESIDLKITHFLHCMGIPAHLNGYNYLRSSLKIAVNDISALDPITKKLYPMIAEKYNKSPQCVERSIRHAIKVSWERGNKKIIYDIFGVSPENLCRGYPTNSEYIAMLADDLRLRLRHNISV